MMASVFARCCGGVGQQLQQRRLVGDERAHPSRMPGDQRQARHRAAAGPEHVGRLGAEIVEDRVDVVGALLGVGLASGSSIGLFGVAARVIGDDGVVAGQRVGQRRELRRGHRRADDEHQRSAAARPRSAGGRRGR